MSVDKFYKLELIGFIGLKALSEYDLSEFSRVSSFSKRELEFKIESLMYEFKDEECRILYSDLKNSIEVSETPNELQILLKQIHKTCIQKTQHLSLQISRQDSKDYLNEFRFSENRIKSEKYTIQLNQHDEITRLAVMLLLRKLPNYNSKFGFAIKNVEIDALLESQSLKHPTIVIETKLRTPSTLPLVKALRSLRSIMNFWGKNALGIIVTTDAKPLNEIPEKETERIFILPYDVENNAFDSRSEGLFLEAFQKLTD